MTQKRKKKIHNKIMNYPSLPLHTCTNEEIHEVIQNALQQERKKKQKGKAIDKKRMITPYKFLNSKLVKRDT